MLSRSWLKKKILITLSVFVIITLSLSSFFLYYEIVTTKRQVYLGQKQILEATAQQIDFYRKNLLQYVNTVSLLVATVDYNSTPVMLSVIRNLKKDKWGEGYIVDSSGKPLICPKEAKWGKRPIRLAAVMQEGFGEVTRDGVEYMASYQKIPGNDWGLVMEVPKDQVLGLVFQVGRIVISCIVLSILILALLTMKWVDKLAAPVRIVRDSLAEVASGNFDVSIDVKGRDEFSHLANSFNVMVDKVRQLRETEKSKLANDYLYDKLTAIGEVAAGAAHEIRNPLTSIKGFALLIQNQFTKGQQVWEYTEIIKVEIRHIEDIIEQFVLMSSPTFPVFKNTNICDLMDEVLPGIAKEAIGNGVTIETRFCETVPELYVDRPQIKQLVTNLCQNSIQAMPKGGKLLIET
ncbi:MAG: histidine kinase dimerization/phospho-acceptor domain-containing protein, partial [Eubacteriales bacterium]